VIEIEVFCSFLEFWPSAEARNSQIRQVKSCPQNTMRSFWDIFRLKDKKVRIILSWAFLYLLFFLIGIRMISEVTRFGYYIDYKHGLRFFGEGAKIAAYGVAGGAGFGFLYTMYLAIISVIKERRKR
jgi:hypothetical protein